MHHPPPNAGPDPPRRQRQPLARRAAPSRPPPWPGRRCRGCRAPRQPSTTVQRWLGLYGCGRCGDVVVNLYPAAWFDKRHRSRVGELTILFSSLGLATAISTRRSGSEATRPGSGLSVGYMPLAAAPRSTKRSRFTLPPSDDRCLRRALTGKEAHGGRWRRAATLLTQWKVAHIPTLTTTP